MVPLADTEEGLPVTQPWFSEPQAPDVVPQLKLVVAVWPWELAVALKVAYVRPRPLAPLVVTDTGGVEKLAVTVVAAFIVTSQLTLVPYPEHAPPHPKKLAPPCPAAVKVTTVPLANEAEQVGLQSKPPTFEVTTPEPVTVNVSVLSIGQPANTIIGKLAAR